MWHRDVGWRRVTKNSATEPTPIPPGYGRRVTNASPISLGADPEHHVSADDFKAVFRGHPGGVALITADAGNGPVALTATSVASVNVDPPLLMFSVTTVSSATSVIVKSDTVVVHLLDVDDIPLAQRGATKGIDRFGDTTLWQKLPTGETAFTGARAWVRCRVINQMDASGSTVIAAEALQVNINRQVGEGSTPLAYVNREWHRLDDASRIDAGMTLPPSA